MPVGCEGVPGAGGARDKWTSRVYRPRLPAGEETLRCVYVPSRFALSESLDVFDEFSRPAGRPATLLALRWRPRGEGFPLSVSRRPIFTRPGKLGRRVSCRLASQIAIGERRRLRALRLINVISPPINYAVNERIGSSLTIIVYSGEYAKLFRHITRANGRTRIAI